MIAVGGDEIEIAVEVNRPFLAGEADSRELVGPPQRRAGAVIKARFDAHVEALELLAVIFIRCGISAQVKVSILLWQYVITGSMRA